MLPTSRLYGRAQTVGLLGYLPVNASCLYFRILRLSVGFLL